MEKEYPQKLNYLDYEHSFSPKLLNDFEEGQLDGFDTEAMRGLIYGYTFTEDYAKGVIPKSFSMDYWASKHGCPQEQFIFDAINSTGNGSSLENAICVISVRHEYEYISRRLSLRIKGQKLILDKNIDCIEFEKIETVEKLYFNISRWFERVKHRTHEPFGIVEN
ncbi:MAG: DUF4919 domain-containing protein [Bacteroidales bacterium]|nr:DUF4919 domain-containing protein [Bacteroidales bacterium]